MQFDRDIRIIRGFLWFLRACNVAFGIFCLLRRDWVNAFASSLWFFNLGAVMRQVRVEQAMRDANRIIEAMLQRVHIHDEGER